MRSVETTTKNRIVQMATLPPASVLLRASEIAIDSDKPIYLDYYRGSVSKECYIVVQESSQCLWKSAEEYTSAIQSVARCDGCFIVVTENSLYIVSAETPIRKGVLPTQS
jgi:hypothetical protein